jgi:hypothetical protein
MVEVKNACWEGLVMWWVVEGLEHAVRGVKVVVVVVVGCVMVLLVAVSVVDTYKNISRVFKKNKKNIPGARDTSVSRAPVVVISASVWLPLIVVVHIL